MSDYIKVIHNVETGKVTKKEMTEAEIEQFLADQAAE